MCCKLAVPGARHPMCRVVVCVSSLSARSAWLLFKYLAGFGVRIRHQRFGVVVGPGRLPYAVRCVLLRTFHRAWITVVQADFAEGFRDRDTRRRMAERRPSTWQLCKAHRAFANVVLQRCLRRHRSGLPHDHLRFPPGVFQWQQTRDRARALSRAKQAMLTWPSCCLARRVRDAKKTDRMRRRRRIMKIMRRIIIIIPSEEQQVAFAALRRKKHMS